MTNCNSLYITYSCSYCSNICCVTSRWSCSIDCYIDCSGVTGVVIGNAKCVINGKEVIITMNEEKKEEENQRLAALRDTLLPKLMSGEIKL